MSRIDCLVPINQEKSNNLLVSSDQLVIKKVFPSIHFSSLMLSFLS